MGSNPSLATELARVASEPLRSPHLNSPRDGGDKVGEGTCMSVRLHRIIGGKSMSLIIHTKDDNNRALSLSLG